MAKENQSFFKFNKNTQCQIKTNLYWQITLLVYKDSIISFCLIKAPQTNLSKEDVVKQFHKKLPIDFFRILKIEIEIEQILSIKSKSRSSNMHIDCWFNEIFHEGNFLFCTILLIIEIYIINRLLICGNNST